MAISTNGTVLARLAGGLYNTTLSNATYTEVSAAVKTAADINTLANDLFARDFAGKTDLSVANTLLTNLGLSSVAGLNNWVAAQLTAAGAANKGAKIVSLLNDFSNLTSDATYGAAATSFNTKTTAALTLSQKAGSTGGDFNAAATLAAAEAAAKAAADAAAAKAAADAAAAKAAADAAAAKAAADAAAAKAAADAAAADAAAKAAADKAAADAAAKAAADKAAADAAAKAAADAAAKAAADKAAADAAAKAAADKAAADAYAAEHATQTFSLTSGVDSGSAFVGKSGDDIFNASLTTGSSPSNTLNTLDSIDGKSGNDTLNVELNANATPLALTSIETVNATFLTTASTLNLVNAPDVTLVKNVGSTVDATFSNLPAAASLSVSTVADKDTTFAYTTTTGTQTVNLALSNVTSTSTSSGASNSAVTLAGIEVVNVTTSGADSSIDLVASSMTTLNVAGNKKLTLSDLSTNDTALTSINASSMTAGGLVMTAASTAATITGGEGNDTIYGKTSAANTISTGGGDDSVTIAGAYAENINGGAGNDTFTFSADATYLSSADTINGGDGIDKLKVDIDSVDSAAATLAAPFTKITSVETLGLAGITGAETVTTEYVATSINRVDLDGTTTGNLTLNMGSGAQTLGLNIAAAVRASDTVTVDAAGTGTADSLAIVNMLSSSGTSQVASSTSSITATDFETVSFNTGSYTTVTSQLINAINVGNNALTLTGSNGLTTTATTGIITAKSIDASAMTGALVMNVAGEYAGSTGSYVISGSNKADTIKGDTDEANSITGGAGNDNITGGSANDSLAGDAGDDTIVGGNGNDTLTGGDGNDTLGTSTYSTGSLVVDGGAGNDVIYGSQGADSLVGGGGNDTFDLGGYFAVSDTVAGGSETDTLSVTAGVADALFANVSSVEKLSVTGAYNVTLGASALAAGITTVTDADTVANATANTVTIDAGYTASVTVALSAGNDTVVNTANTTLNVTALAASITSSDVLTGGTGTDTLTLTADSNATGANLSGMTLFNSVVIAAGDTGVETAKVSTTGSTSVVATGATLTVDATALTNSSATLNFDGSANTTTGKYNMTGGAGADTLKGGSGADTIVGGGGADSISGGSGADVVYGGTGDDTIDLGTSTSTTTQYAYGEDGADSIVGGSYKDIIDGGTGNDTISGGGGNDSLTGGDGQDSITGGSANDTISGGADNDVIAGGNGNDSIDAGGGDDTISTGGADADVSYVVAGDGNDIINMGAYLTYSDTVSGGLGNDTLTITGTAANADINFLNVSSIETLKGGAAALTMTLGSYASAAGITAIDMTASDDQRITLAYGFANAVTATLTGDASSNADSIVNSANVALTVVANAADVDSTTTITGGTGTDVINLKAADTTAANNAADLTAVSKVETITVVAGTTAVDNDLTITMGAVDTTIAAGATLTVNGAALTDLNATLTFTGSESELDGYLYITGGNGGDSLTGGGAADTIFGGIGADSINGGSGADYLDGGADADTINGGAGADVIIGGAGNNVLAGDAGNDTITGGASADTITGGAGADKMTGNGGNDTFYVNSNDATGAVSDGGQGYIVYNQIVLAGSVLNTSLMDVITDFNAGDKIYTGTGMNSTTGTNAVGVAWTQKEGYLRGTFNETAMSFTFSTTGLDTLYVYDRDGNTSTTGDFAGVVLVGYVDAGTNDFASTATTGLLGVA